MPGAMGPRAQEEGMLSRGDGTEGVFLRFQKHWQV